MHGLPDAQRDTDRREAFERVAVPFAAALLRTARRLTRPANDAEDVVQETLLRAYRTFDGFGEGTNARAWLFTILRSVLANRWRRDGLRREEMTTPHDLDARFSAAAASGDVERALADRIDASAALEAGVRALPVEYRTVVLLVDVEGLTYEEAAEVMACPVGTVRSRLSRARKMLVVTLHEHTGRRDVAAPDQP